MGWVGVGVGWGGVGWGGVGWGRVGWGGVGWGGVGCGGVGEQTPEGAQPAPISTSETCSIQAVELAKQGRETDKKNMLRRTWTLGGPLRKKCTIWQLRGFWQDRSVRKNGAQLSGTRAWPIWSHKIVKSLIFRIFDILGKSLHHQVVLGPPNGSRDFPQKLGVAGPAAFGENTF